MVLASDTPNLWNDPAFWISLMSVLAAVSSAIFAYWSARSAKRMLRLAESSEQRRQPQLLPRFGEGYCKVLPNLKERIYVFAILINNPTDSVNAVSRIELQVGYTTENQEYMTLKLPLVNRDQALHFADHPLLHLPLTIEAHGSVAGSVMFCLDDELVNRKRIDDLKLLITDSHEQTTRLEPAIIRDLIDAKEIKKD